MLRGVFVERHLRIRQLAENEEAADRVKKLYIV
jgi:hypothetical protein